MKRKNTKTAFVPRRSDLIISRKNFDSSITILHLHRERHFYFIDGIAAQAFELINGANSIEKIKVKLEKEISPPSKKFEADISKFFKWLTKEGIVVPNENAK